LPTTTTDEPTTRESGRAGPVPAIDGSPRFLAPFSRPGFAVAMIALTAAALLFFNRFSGIDIYVAQLFFTEAPCPEGSPKAVCGAFPASENLVLDILRDVMHVMPPAIAVLLMVFAVSVALNRSPGAGRVRLARGAVTAIASLLICSLGLVNLVLKAESGRPRPYQTDMFGGKLPFVEAGRFTDYCDTNCSFVSGESSAAFWLLCLVPLVPSRWRPAALAAALVVAFSAAGLRVAFGAHYLSDVTIAALLSLAVFSLLAMLGTRLGWYRTER